MKPGECGHFDQEKDLRGNLCSPDFCFRDIEALLQLVSLNFVELCIFGILRPLYVTFLY